MIVILNATARALEARGLKLEAAGTCMRVSAAPDALTFSLTERVERRHHVPTMEELAKEERLRKKKERDAPVGLSSFSRERAYPEFDFVRTGELGIQIADQYVQGLRRSWRDGKHQRLERLADDIAGGIVTYLAGVKARREEHERRERERQRREQLRALARARHERETRRREFLQRLVTISAEADELRSFLARPDARVPAHPCGELVRMTEWADAQLQRLEGELTPEGISVTLRERKLFPEIDDLAELQSEES